MFDLGPVIVMLDAVDSVIYKVCPFVAAGIVVGSVYWTAVTFGAITVMQASAEIWCRLGFIVCVWRVIQTCIELINTQMLNVCNHT